MPKSVYFIFFLLLPVPTETCEIVQESNVSKTHKGTMGGDLA